MRSWPTRPTRPPRAGAPSTTDPPRSSEHDRATDAVRRTGAASLSARGPRDPGRPRPVCRDARADHAVLGHIGIHRRRARARHPASAGEPAVRADRPHLGLAAAGGGVRDADQPAGGGHERDCGGILVPRERAVDAGVGSRAPAAPTRRPGGRARRGHGVHRLEPVGGEREGLHAVAALDRPGAVAHRALGRSAGRRGARSSSADDRVPARPHVHEPHDGRARGAGRRGAVVPAPQGPAAVGRGRAPGGVVAVAGVLQRVRPDRGERARERRSAKAPLCCFSAP